MSKLDEVKSWLKIFIISFIVVALVRYGFETLLNIEHNEFSIAFSAGVVALVFATAQWVLRPRLKSAGMQEVVISLPSDESSAAVGMEAQTPQAEDAEPDLNALLAPTPAISASRKAKSRAKSKSKSRPKPKAKSKPKRRR